MSFASWLNSVQFWVALQWRIFKRWWSNVYTKTFKFDRGADFFAGVRCLEIFCGFYANLRSASDKFWWRILRLVIAFRMSHITGKFIFTFLEEDDFKYKVLVHTATYLMFCNCIQMFLLRISYNEITSIRSFINCRPFLSEDPEAHQVRWAAYRKNLWTILVPIPSNIFIWIFLFASGAYKWRVVNIDPDTLASIPWLRTSVQLFYWLQYSVGVEWFQLQTVLVNSMLYGLAGELGVVTYGCENLMQNVDSAVQEELLNAASTSDSSRAEAIFWKHFKIELNKCARAHSEVMEQLINLKRILKPCLLMYYYSLLIVNAIIICAIKHGYFEAFTIPATVMVIYLNVDFFFICFNLSVLDDLFSREYRDIKSTLKIMLMRTQTGMKFSCGGFFVMSLEKFAELMELTYNMVMFVLQFHH
ncbi:uncharacterized protein LOC128092842 [Culex pipiens pallens]|uniref:uncharacterized protein LOC128092842 n=1 Tax=Culex pipiens pallens TaxID=42434 RepID=UPI0022AA8672|nr:uncharacterized protein LOC128092842 [Culex pipiens pallens]